MRVLIVDDSPDDVELLRIEFEREGYKPVFRRVDTEGDLREALHAAEWDMIIADDSMPAFNALRALDTIKRSGRDIPFIICSGTMKPHSAAMAMREGAHDFVEKGDFARLIPSVERELRNAAVRKAMKGRARI